MILSLPHKPLVHRVAFGLGFGSVVWLVLVLLPALADAKKAADLAVSLARLRSEVESLSAQVDERKQAFRSQLRSMAMRQSSLSLQLQQASLQLQQVRRKQLRQQQKVQQAGQHEAALAPVLVRAIAKLRKVVEQSLPFRRNARLGSLAKLEKQLQAKVLLPRQAANRLWQFVEDELRLGRENGLHRQMIALRGKQQLVDVARLGMVMLFFKTRDGKYGSAVFSQGRWGYQLLRDKVSIEQVSALFQALRQQIRVGFWTLPNRLR